MGVNFKKKPIDKIPVVAETTIQHPTGGTQSKQEVIETVISDVPLANVGMTVGQTLNTGDYNNIKVSVSLHYPCQIEEIDATFETVKEWLDTKMSVVMGEIVEGLGK